MYFPRSILILLFSCLTVCLYSQHIARSVSVDKQRILLGEPMVLTVVVKVQAGYDPVFVRIDSIPHFEMIAAPVIDTINEGDGVSVQGIYKLTSFDSGHWVIPAFSLSNGSTQKTDTIPVDVVFSENFNPEQEYHDIKDIIEVKPKAKKQWWWYAIGGALLLTLLLYYLLRKKKPKRVTTVVSSVSAFDEAMQQLEKLQRNKPAVKQYHTQLVDIFRLYIFRRKQILSLQKTTDDLILQLKGLDMGTDQYNRLSQALRMADFVKFARYVPGAEDDSNSYKEIWNAIMTIEEQMKPTVTEQKID